jgi:hypothetical protein
MQKPSFPFSLDSVSRREPCGQLLATARIPLQLISSSFKAMPEQRYYALINASAFAA